MHDPAVQAVGPKVAEPCDHVGTVPKRFGVRPYGQHDGSVRIGVPPVQFGSGPRAHPCLAVPGAGGARAGGPPRDGRPRKKGGGPARHSRFSATCTPPASNAPAAVVTM